jgi:hypothetical protein
MRSRPAIAAVTGIVAGIAATGYALASNNPAPGWTPRVVCAAAGTGLLTITGRLPGGVSTAYIVSPDGASLQRPVRGGGYTFLVPAPAAGSVGPTRLEYLDPAGHRHEEALSSEALARCRARSPLAAAAGLPAPGPAGGSAPVTAAHRAPGESAGAWAETLVNEASTRVEDNVAACNLNRLSPQPVPARLSPGSPSPVLLEALGVLRRGPTPEELALAPGGAPLGSPSVLEIFRGYTRIVHGPDGLVATITVGQGQVSVPALDLPPCQRIINRFLDVLLSFEPPDVKFYAREFRQDFKLGPLNLGSHPWLLYDVGRAAEIGSGGPFDPQEFARNGLIVSGSPAQLPNPVPIGPPVGATPSPPTTLVAGLVPDGVASVTVDLPAAAGYPPRIPTPAGSGIPLPARATLGKPYTATAHVTENVFFLPGVPGNTGGVAHPATIVWRDRNGHVVRVIRDI